MKWLLATLLAAALLVSLYTVAMLHWSYSTGERAGYLRKLSKKGWICKTWEGELALVTMPGTVAETFLFSVRDDAVAAKLNETIGGKVALDYQQHVGLPTSCFGETQYFIVGVRRAQD